MSTRKYNSKKKPRRRDQSKKSEEVESKRYDSGDVKSSTNDPAWYGRTPELLRDAASIPFSNAAGVPFNLDIKGVEQNVTFSADRVVIPGLMTFDVIPCPHADPYANDPLNIAANSMLGYIVHANSRNLTYSASDLMIYNLAMGNVYAYINFLMRIYGTTQLFSVFNRNIPSMLAAAQYVNYTDVINHLADFRYGINLLINKAASFAAPADMPYFRRLAFLFSGLYSEGESIKDQLYMFVPAGFMQYSDTASQQGSSLVYKAFNGNPSYTVDQLLKYGNDLLNAIIGSEDMNIISGDILKAYGDGGILKLATMPEVYNVLPVTDLAVLEQMQNCTFVDSGVANITATIQQSSSHTNTFALWGGATFQAASAGRQAVTNQFMCNTILTNPEAADVMERTRLQCGMQENEDETMLFYGTEVVSRVGIWQNQGGTPARVGVPLINAVSSASSLEHVSSILNVHCLLETFKFHPKTFYFSNTSNNWKLIGFAMDTDNYAVYDWATLERMHEAAIMSLFIVDSIGIIR